MANRTQYRIGNGQWRKQTLGNTFGLVTDICLQCRAFNPRSLGEPAPELCPECGAILHPEAPDEQETKS